MRASSPSVAMKKTDVWCNCVHVLELFCHLDSFLRNFKYLICCLHQLKCSSKAIGLFPVSIYEFVPSTSQHNFNYIIYEVLAIIFHLKFWLIITYEWQGVHSLAIIKSRMDGVALHLLGFCSHCISSHLWQFALVFTVLSPFHWVLVMLLMLRSPLRWSVLCLLYCLPSYHIIAYINLEVAMQNIIVGRGSEMASTKS